jgi:hypothetical protein
MDSNTARQEAIAFSTGPSQAMTYQIGKLPDGFKTVLLSDRLLYFADVTTTTSSRGQTLMRNEGVNIF